MFNLTSGIGELIVRAAIVYIFVFSLFRFGGKSMLVKWRPLILLFCSSLVNP